MPSNQTFRIKLLGGEWATQMTCREANCANHRNGWLTALDVSNDDHAKIATFIKESSGRKFFEMWSQEALDEVHRLEGRDLLNVSEQLRELLERIPSGIKVFIFPAGQECFSVHEDREVKFVHLPDARDSRRVYEHKRPLDFNEHYNEEAYKLERAKERG